MIMERTASGQVLEERGQWGSKAQFLLAVTGNIVGLGNVWRFPYLCYKNGGGTFLIPYLFFAMACGIPLALLETAMGQYTKEGAITCWRKFCPLAEGVGYGSVLTQSYICVCYIIILAWALFYLYYSFSPQLPWASCFNTWNSDHCVDFSNQNLTANWTHPQPNDSSSAAKEFWERRVLQISGGIEDLGSIRWEVLLCLIIMWIICYFCIWKGVKSTGKAVYFTATFPYLMLLALLIRGLTLPGAQQGVLFYLYPNPSHLADPQVWLEAGAQIFFSYSVGGAALTVLGSYNHYNNNFYKDTFFLCLLNSATTESGPGLVFIAYPQAVAMMPLPQMWAVFFFIMILLLGLDTQFVTIEVVVTSVTDLFPRFLRQASHREIFLLLFCITCFVSQLGLVTQGGMYIFQLLDYYAANGACVFVLSVFRVLSMGWLFGADRTMDIVEDMTGQQPNLIFKLCWCYVTPLVTLGSLIFALVDYKPLTYNRWYVYPDWAYVLGWLLAVSSVALVPGCALVKLLISTGTLKQRFYHLCRPADDLPLTRKQMAERDNLISAAEMEGLRTNRK
ncbi:hypothetical protein GJAV_G00058510 [Gymnothorax javanicus]|nr:hypothetical protein GJAV_G00058510 [Gymnothorax javanicus]